MAPVACVLLDSATVNQSTVGKRGPDAVSVAPGDTIDDDDIIIEGDWPAFLAKHMGLHGWDNLDLAGATGIDRSQISRWRRNEGLPTPKNVRAVCAAFCLDIRFGIVATGQYTADEVRLRNRGRREVLRTYKPEELTEELLDRVHAAAPVAEAVPPPSPPVSRRRGSFTEQHKPVIAPLTFQDGSTRNGRAR